MDGGWPAADAHRASVDRYWRKRIRDNPSFFDGRVYVLADMRFEGGAFVGRYIETDFSCFIAWRDGVFPDEDIRDSFAAGLVVSSDGGILLGRQRAGNLNAGFIYPPGGFIDRRDVDSQGRIGIIGSAQREILEETGIDLSDVRPCPTFRISLAGRIVALGVYWRLALTSTDVLRIAEAHIGRHPDGELEACVMVHSAEEVAALPVPDYAKGLVRDVLTSYPE